MSQQRSAASIWIAGVALLFIQIGFIRLQSSLPRNVSTATVPQALVSALSGTSLVVGDGADGCPVDTPVSVENIEHFKWSYCDFDLRPFWQSLGVPAGTFQRSQSLSQLMSSYGDFDGDGVDERILHIYRYSEGMCRIVILKHLPQGEWTSIGFLDLETFHLFPTARVVTNGRGRWLAVSEHTESAWGTGIFQEEEAWYADDHRRLRKVLSFPEKGELAGPLQFAWKTNISLPPADGSRDVIRIEYSVTLGTSLGDGIGGDFQHIVTFSKNASSRNFGFDAKLSEMRESEFRTLYEVGDLDWERWGKLVRLAAKNDAAFSDVFDRVLNTCGNAENLFWNCHEIAEELLRSSK
jgi:hypothetical protein